MSQQWFIGDCPSDGDVPDCPSWDVDNTTLAYANPVNTQESSTLYGEATFRHLRGSASMPSSSPVSLTFSSDGMSRVNSSSCLDTPATSHTDLLRDQPVGRTGKFVNSQCEVKGWRGYEPGSTDKRWRACYPCFVRKQTCQSGDKPTRCVHCENSQSYCKGPIDAPIFVNVDALRDAASSAMLKMMTFPDHPVSELFTLSKPDLKSQCASQQSLPMPVPLPLTEYPYLDELPLASEMLDDLLASGNIYPRAIKTGVDLVKFEGLCRRFCACMILLRSLKMCRIDPHIKSCHQTYRLALGFVIRLSLLANDSLNQIFEQVKTCCESRRHRPGTKKTMSTLASFLGQIVAEMRHLYVYAQSFPHILLLPILEQFPKAEQNITFYGKGFDDDTFVARSQSDRHYLPGLHLPILDQDPVITEARGDDPLSEWQSVFDILNFDFSSSRRPDDLDLAPKMQNAISIDQTCDEAVDFNLTDACQDTFLAVRRGRMVSQATGKLVDLPKPANETIAQIETEKAQIQVKIDGLQNLMTNMEKEIEYLKRPPSLHESRSEETSYEQHSLSKSAGKEHGEKESSVQLEANFQSDLNTFSMHDFNEIRSIAEEDFSQNHLPEMDENIDMMDFSTVDESKQDRKRKRVSPPAPSKKQKDDALPGNGTMSVIDLPDESTAMVDAQISYSKPRIRDSTIAQLKKQVTEVLCNSGQPQDNEQESTPEDSDPSDFIETDTKVSPLYESRPKTWPFRQAFRRSVDFSVSSLVKGLAKLKV